MSNPIEAAVMPLKTDAVERAEKYARGVIERVMAELAAADWSDTVVAPYPKSNQGRESYHVQLSKYRLVSMLTKWNETTRGGHRPNESYRCHKNEEGCALYITRAREDAAYQYDQFVAKLVHKIGECSTATLAGSHVWGHSILTVRKDIVGGQTTERWKTQMIVNVSKLGKIFNQFPTRKVK